MQLIYQLYGLLPRIIQELLAGGLLVVCPLNLVL